MDCTERGSQNAEEGQAYKTVVATVSSPRPSVRLTPHALARDGHFSGARPVALTGRLGQGPAVGTQWGRAQKSRKTCRWVGLILEN